MLAVNFKLSQTETDETEVTPHKVWHPAKAFLIGL